PGDLDPSAGPMSARQDQNLDVATLADLLREAEAHHGAFEAATPKHSWADWYAPFVLARLDRKTSDQAIEAADQHMKDEFGVVRQ
ncbi:MAG: hypothetical protein LC792_24065, partial [Actinobacteria bacterium]|nr:hypothetical protein [Actinomycetota bacterium]